MVDERLYQLAKGIHRSGVREIENLVVDDSLFVSPPRASGEDPYQAALSAVSLNYNCYSVHLSPSGATLPAFVELTSGAPYKLVNRVKSLKSKEQGFTITQSRGSADFNPIPLQRKIGNYRVVSDNEMTVTVQGYLGVEENSKIEYRTVPYPSSYFASVLKKILQDLGVKINKEVVIGQTPGSAKLLLKYESPPLIQILYDLNHYSSNFIAGQLAYVIGQDEQGLFRQDLGLQRIGSVISEMGFEAGSFNLVDASGLSSENRVTTEQLVKALIVSYRDFGVFADLTSSLSRFGRSGTLKKRKLLDTELLQTLLKREVRDVVYRGDAVWGKTGTIDGVSSVVGYLELPSGKRAAFGIVVNGASKNVAAKIEEDLLQILIGLKK